VWHLTSESRPAAEAASRSAIASWPRLLVCLLSFASLILATPRAYAQGPEPCNVSQEISGLSQTVGAAPGGLVNVSASPADSRAPALAVAEGVVHIVWEEDDRIKHRTYDGAHWSVVRSIAVGEQPAIVTDGTGHANLAFVNEFGGNFEIYHCRWSGSSWSLPRNVSNTSGVSSSPALGVASDGTIHIAWADNTPGYNVIYHAFWSGVYWINGPMPNAFGGAPALAVEPSGVVHVVWQDRDQPGGPYEIYYSRRTGTAWSLPEDLSDSAGQQSIIPAITIGPGGVAHVAWQERLGASYTIQYTYGVVGYWSVPEQVPDGVDEAYLPSLTVSESRSAYVGWDQSTAARYRQRAGQLSWSECTTVIGDAGGVTDLQLAVDAAGRVRAVWAQGVEPGNWDVFYQMVSRQLALPMVLKRFRS
jgi:uncharacterized protein YfiM (DUF2279 family)